MTLFDELKDAVIRGTAPVVPDLVKLLLNDGESPDNIIDNGLLPAMDVVGEKFKNNEYFVPQVLFAARAMKAGMEVVKPLLVANENLHKKGTILIGTARGDQHDIGKNLVAMMLESAGFNVIDLGTDVSPDMFIESLQAEKADVISISALMTTTMAEMPVVINTLKEKGLRENVKILIGGAPVTREFATEIGADGFGENATDAVDVVRQLLVQKEG